MTEPRDSADELSPLRRAFVAVETLQAKLARLEAVRVEPLAIVGMGCRFPGGAADPESFWRLLRDGVDAMSEVPRDRWDVDAFYDPDPATPGKTSTRCGGFIKDVDRFDAAFFGIAPREAVAMDPQQRLLLEVTWEALEHAGQAPDRLSGSKTGVYVGMASGDYARLSLAEADPARIDAYYASGNAHSIAAGRLSYLLGLQGPSVTIDTACSSSLVAVHLACQSLRSGECRMAVAGGVHLTLAPENTIAFSKARMLASDGRCKTFDAAADGFSEGEGCGIVVLKRLSDALADGDRVLAIVRGSAVNQDGPSAGLTAPSGPAQEAVIREALANAGVAPHEVAYVEAHGTGTALGDPIEVRALAAALTAAPRSERLLLGSVKTNVGHLEAAAGVAGLIKLVLALQHDEIPPHLHLRTPNPHIGWAELPVEVVTARRPWPAGRRLAGVSAFGFSGTNAHVLVEVAPDQAVAPSAHERPAHVLTLSAKSEPPLRELAERYERRLSERDLVFADACFTAATGRAQLEHRLAIVGRGADEARDLLGRWLAGETSPRTVRGHVSPGRRAPRVGFLFPGQGAQYGGMGRGLYEGSGVFRAAVERCAAAARGALERPLVEVLYGGASGALEETAYTQVGLFAVEWGLAELWRAWGVQPAVVLGHSVGEYVAACVAGVLEVEAAVGLVAARGRLMGALPRGGAMVAVHGDEATVGAVVAAVGGGVGIAAVNGPGSVVVSGEAGAVGAVVAALEGRGIRSQGLRVSHAFHSVLMEPMQGAFGAVAAGVGYGAPQVTMVSTVTGAVVGAAELGAEYWVRQVREPVRFAAGMATLASAGVDVFLEVGPGTTLLGLGRQCVGEGGGIWVPSLRQGQPDWDRMLESLATLWIGGIPIDWEAVDRGYARRRLSLPTYAFQRERYWLPAAPARSGHGAKPGARRADPSAHPLLARRVPSPLATVQFEAELRTDAPDFLGQHRIGDAAVLPATAYLEMIGAAVEAIRPGDHVVDDVTFQEPLVVVDGEERGVQVVLMPDGHEEATAVEVWALEEREGKPTWRRHATGRVHPDRGSVGAPVALDRVRARLGEELSAEAFYARVDGRALELGPSFRGVRRVWRVEGEALGEILLPPDVTDAARYRIHPVLLDACVQVLAAALPDGAAEGSLYLPMALDRFRLLHRPGARLWSLVRLTSAPGDTVSADLQVLDESGRPVAEMTGLRLKRTDRGLAGKPPARVGEWLYRVQWQAAAALAAPPTGDIGAGRVAAEVERWRDAPTIARYAETLRDLDRLSVAYIEETLAALGCDLTKGRALRLDAMVTATGVAPRYRRLLARLLEILEEDGVLRGTPDGWMVAREPGRVDVPDVEREVARRAGTSPELVFLRRCGPRLADVLRGACDPLSLLFPDGSFELAERLYHESPMVPALGGLVRETVLAARERLPRGRPIRILEVGGGTGGTTAAVLPALAQASCEYVFTDVSPAFTARAAERFATYPFLRTRVLDLESDPAAQGVVAGQFDVVIAANVVHATADLRRTVEHCRRLLAPGGVLVLVEVTVPQRWVDLTFGLTDGWWKFTDADLRPRYPLLSAEGWLRLLGASGFRGVRALPEPGSTVGRLAEQAVIVAVRDETAVSEAAPAGPWLIFADRGGIGDGLAAALRDRGEPCLVLRAGERYATEDGAITVDPEQIGHIRRALEASDSIGQVRPRGAVHLWALDAPASLDVAVATGAPLHLAVGGLHAIQALLAGAERGTRLWLVTRGAHRLASDAGLPAATQAPLWGLGRTIGLEHPEMACVCVDLDPSPVVDPVPALLAELAGPSDEDEVAWRGDERHAPRLVRWPGRAEAAREAAPFKVETTTPGSLESLACRPASRRTPGPGEVEIRVRASGLNFKDVLNALAMYPGDAGPLGSECAGTVVAVGPGVEDLAVGTEVVAIAAGCLGTHVTVDVALVVAKPPSLAPEQAASLPVAYVTAAYALSTVGAVRAGDRVLIHAGAGGVGLAAVRVAQQCGAQVLATAGSPAKREFLRAQGVGHVFDSRSLEFRDRVMAATGGRGVDVVLNSLSGESIDASLAVVASGGRFLEIGKRGILDAAEVARRRPDVRYVVIDWSDVARATPAVIRRHLTEVLEAVEAGRLAVPPVSLFPLTDAVAAFRHMAQARHIGKIVLVAPREVPATPPSVRADATYLVTGGFGGLGLEVARWLVERGARSLVLTGRRAPSEAAGTAIAALREAGTEVSLIEADVARADAVERVMAEIARARRPLRGIVHAAGTLDNAVLSEQDAGRLARVMAAKVDGTWNLERATRHLTLDFFVLFSSAAALLGSPGQANHAAANVFLDAVAHHRRARGLAALSLDWGAWSEVGAAAREETARRIALQGMGRMRPDEALVALAIAMNGDEAQVAVLPVDWASLRARRSAERRPSLLRALESGEPGPRRSAASAGTAEALLARLREAAPAKRQRLLSEHIASRVTRVLGLDASQVIDPLRPLKELGIDSLMAVELRNVLKADLALEGGLPATLVFDYPTVEAIAVYLGQTVLGLPASGPEPGGSPESADPASRADGVLSRVELLSDDEVDRMLGERLRSAGP